MPSLTAELDGVAFASSIAIDGDILVAGVVNPIPQVLGAAPKGVYVYHRDPSGAWRQEARLVHPDAAAETFFYGYSISVSGNRVMVGGLGGVHANGTLIPDLRHGAIYEFTRTVSITAPTIGMVSWTPTGKIIGTTKAISDDFGRTFAISGDTVVVGGLTNTLLGGLNTVAIYQRGASGWSAAPTAILKPSDLTPLLPVTSVRHGINFGSSVALSGSTLLVGGAFDISGGTAFGSAYVFERNSAGVWSQQAKLVPKSRSNRDNFSRNVSLAGNLALFGYRPDGAAAGRASLFNRVGTNWSETLIKSPGIPIEVNDKVDNFATFANVSSTGAALISQAWAGLSREWIYRAK